MSVARRVGKLSRVVLAVASAAATSVPAAAVAADRSAPVPEAAVSCTAAAGFTHCTDYTYSGGDQSFVVPAAVTSINAGLSGAGGGGTNGAAGGRTVGTLAVTPGQTINVMVGQAGSPAGARAYGEGGSGGNGSRFHGGSGGGMSALWNGPAKGTPFLIAGGGGGGAMGGSSGATGGGTNGSNAPSAAEPGAVGAGGGTQSAGGARATSPSNTCTIQPVAGAKFAGGNGGNGSTPVAGEGGGGGGGGWYGGGGGSCRQSITLSNSDSGGAGGSGYIGGAGVSGATTTAGTGSAARANGTVRIQWYQPAVWTQASVPTTPPGGAGTTSFNVQFGGFKTYTFTPPAGVKITGWAGCTGAGYTLTIASDGGSALCNAGTNNPGKTGTVAANLTYTVDAAAAPDTTLTGGQATVSNPDGTSAATAWSVKTAVADACGYYSASLVNPSFEVPVIGNATNIVTNQSNVPGWSATASDGNIEIWSSGFLSTPAAPDGGRQFAELNATQIGTLFQDVATVPGTPMSWSIYHRGRDGVETMKVRIGPSGGTLVDQTPTGAASPIISDGKAWRQVRGTYVVPAGQTSSRFAFVSLTPPGGAGNLLDGIAFGTPGCLAASKSVTGNNPVQPGNILTYTVTVTNPGSSETLNSFITDIIPAGTSFQPGSIQIINPSGTATPVSDGDGFTGTGIKVAVGNNSTPAGGGMVGPATTWKVVFQVKVLPTAGATIDNSARGQWVPYPGGTSRQSAPAVTSTPVNAADLTTTKQALNATPVVPGGTFDYTVTVRNNGPAVATNVRATDTLPVALTFQSGTGCTAVGQTVSCGPEASLAAGASKSWTFTVKLDAGYTGDGSDLGNIARATSDTPDPFPSNNSNPPATPNGVASPSADLAMAKTALNTAPVVPGTTFSYRLTVTNNGLSTATMVRGTDTLPTALTFVSSADGCTAATGTVTCGPEASMAPGASKSWVFTVRLDAGYTGDGSDLGNVAIAGSPVSDPSPANNSNTPVPPSGGVASAAADLVTSKTALNTSPVVPGTTFDYQITVTNNGPSTAVNVGATDPLPTALAFVSSVDGCTFATGTVTCPAVAALAVGATKTWVFTVRLDAGYTGDGSDLGNVVTATSDTPDPSPSNNRNTPPALPSGGVASASADLTTAKTALNTAPVVPGTTFDYQITVINNGPSTAVNVGTTDPLPTALAFVSSVDGCTFAAGTVTCPAVATLAVGATKTWVFTVRLDAGYTGDGSDLGNIVTATSDTPDPSPSNNRNTPPALPSGGVASASADLTTAKTALNTSPVVPGTTFDYQITVINNGPSTAVNVGTTDPLPAALAFVSSVDGCTFATGTVTCPAVATLAVGASKTWVFTVRLDAGYTGDGSDLGNVATAKSDTPDPSPSNNMNTPPAVPSGGVASASADLTTAKTALNTAPVVPGTTFDYQITVTNNGPSTALNVGATDPLPTALVFVSSTDGCTAASQDVTCPAVATLAVGASKTWVFTVRLDAGYTGDGSDLGNVATAKSDTPDPSPSNNMNTPPAVPSGGVASASADLTTAKTALSAAPVVPGTTFDYQITVTNNGPSTAVNVGATDPLPVALGFVSSVDGCTFAAGTVTCPAVATLAVGSTRTWVFTVRLDAGYTGDGSDLGNVATAKSDTPDPSPSNNMNTPPALPSGGVASASADLTTAKIALNTSPVVPGTTFDYQTTVTNNGPSTAVNVGATDPLPVALTFVSSVDGCTFAGGTVTCPAAATLAVGSTKTWVFTVRLDAGYTGDGSDLGNVATAKSDTPDPLPSNNMHTPPALPSGGVASASADLATTKTAMNASAVVPGTTFDYQIAVTNNGPSTAVNVGATDPLPTPLAFLSSVDGCTFASGAVTCPAVATLAVGATKTWVFTVRLDAGYTGDGSDLGNVVTAKSDTPDPSPSNNMNTPPASPGPIPSPLADLVTAKVATNTAPVVPGTMFDYQITVTNNGPSTAVNVTASDPLPTALTFVSSVDGCSASSGTVACGPEPSLAPGASKSWTFTVLLDAGYTGDGSDLGNVATAGASTLDPSPSNNANTPPALPSGGVASASADLTTQKVALNTAPVVPGETFEYRITVTNNGPSEAKNVGTTDPLPTALAFVSSADGCTAAGQDVTCPAVATLAVGAAKSWTFTVRLDAGYTGDGSDLGNVATATSDTPDPAPSNNMNTPPASPSGGVARPAADLVTTKKALNTAPVVPGTTFDYEVTVTNNGPSVALAVDVIASDPLPVPLSFVSSVDQCTLQPNSTVVCGPVASLRAGTSAKWVFTVRLDPGYTGDGSDLGNVAIASSSNPDPSPSNNRNTPVPPSGGVASASADLVTAKTALNTSPVVPGTTFEYRITVTNNGPSTAVNVGTTDPLPTALTFVSSVDGCTFATGTVTCPAVATLAVGASKTWMLTVKLDAGYTGDGSDLGNVATAKSDTPDPSPSNNMNTPPALPSGGVTDPQGDVAVTITAKPNSSLSPGASFTYEVKVKNHGPSAAKTVKLRVDLPTGVVFGSADQGGAPMSPTIGWPDIDSLAPGETRAFLIQARIDSGYTGDGSDLVATSRVSSATADGVPSNNIDTAPVSLIEQVPMPVTGDRKNPVLTATAGLAALLSGLALIGLARRRQRV